MIEVVYIMGMLLKKVRGFFVAYKRRLGLRKKCRLCF